MPYKANLKTLFVVFFLLTRISDCGAWGFFAHQRINRLAVFCLPEPMSTFFKRNIVYITENAVNPDRRRNAVKGEAAKHYIDIDVYGDSALWKMPRRWTDAVAKYGEDTLQAYGIVPWEVNRMKYSLQKAFEKRDTKAILRIASDMGHYIADSNVPLHTTQNYNGQMSGQKGIHGFWESRLPELYSDKYDYFVGAAEYENRVQERSWKGVTEAHLALDSVLRFEKELNARWPEDKKYSFEQKGNMSVQVYSREYSAAYHRMLGRQVENRMRASVKEVADLWYTAWVDAGQPDLNQLLDYKLSEDDIKEMEEEQKLWQQKTLQVRPEETTSLREFDVESPCFSGSLCCREDEDGHGH